MKSRASALFVWVKQNYIKAGSIVIFVIILFRVIFGGTNGNVETITLTLQEFTRIVAISGKVTPADDVELGFETTGKIAAVYKREGEHVTSGETLVVLSSGDASADVLKAQADLDAEIARLNELQLGKIGTLGTTLETSQRELFEAISDAYTRSDDAVRNSVDQFYEDGRKNNPEIVFAFNDNDLRIELNKTRKLMETLLIDWKEEIDTITVTSISSIHIDHAEKNLMMVKSFLDRIALAVNDFQVSGSPYTQTEINTFKSDISSARSSINTVISALVRAKDSVRDIESEIPYQQARVKAAQATLDAYRSELGKRSITAPFNGVVTQQNAEVGQIVSANNVVMRLISDATFTIETYVPEVNIKDVKVGNTAKVTLDAYGDAQIFEAKVISIDPGETIRDGVSTYKVIFEFITNDDRLKSGMTANVIITTETKPDALLIPQESVTRRNGYSYVTIVVGKAQVEKQVTTGAVASNGYIEVLAGLSEGEVIIKNAQ